MEYDQALFTDTGRLNTGRMRFATCRPDTVPDATAPDGSEVRGLCGLSRGAVAVFILPNNPSCWVIVACSPCGVFNDHNPALVHVFGDDEAKISPRGGDDRPDLV